MEDAAARRTPPSRTVVMMCGPAGSGKTTYALDLEESGYTRLSIDEEIWRRFGRDGAEFAPEEYERHKSTAEEELWARLAALMRAGRPVVLDYSFWSRETRRRYQAFIESHGYRWELVYLKADRETLQRRLAARNAVRGANAVTVSEELLDRYLAGFQEPVGEGERTVLQR
ncbi:kinase [Planomonospora sphaerica]|uniref:Kinase n=1 Tax=Planomonospora sphaerica TaxID=161355 RepID=A0A171BT82_9ACTN|nr:ATP-binding protein [Planomonospora sphaerica]GAT65532.1 kinase [Planomonospora sphaerica]